MIRPIKRPKPPPLALLAAIIGGLLLAALADRAGLLEEAGLVLAGVLLGWLTAPIWKLRPELPPVVRAAVENQLLLDAARTVMRDILLHVSALNDFGGITLEEALEYLSGRNIESLDSALLSSDDPEVRESWRAFETGSESKLRAAVLHVVGVMLASRSSVFLERKQIPYFASGFQF